MPLLFAVLIGALLPLQTVINTRLRWLLHSPLRASLASFGVGTACLIVAVMASDAGWPISRSFIAQQPWWIWLGGACGVVFLTGNIVLFPRLGSVQTVVMPILGQILAADVIDSCGWFDAQVRPWSWSRATGTCLAIAGMLLVVAGPDVLYRRIHSDQPATDVSQGRELHGRAGAGRWIWRLAGLGMGTLSAMQTSVNGTLGVHMHSAIAASLVSFLVGLVILAVAVLVETLQRSARRPAAVGAVGATGANGMADAASGENTAPKPLVKQPVKWWHWIGGALGATFVYGNAMLAPLLGTGLTVVVVLLGQLGGSLVVDQFGVLGAACRPVKAIQVCGVVVLIAGAALMRLG
ncbi:MAG: DMT family transporter [Bifidobacterium tibiigranuli]|jgi:transporter family-2 protein|uniref:DMT family transporter n=1 Tax=Bifidobacterium tibiigranuli TaxID=2172043 RepID=UPI0026E99D47|nr:DMT family transporter [Bifidobacterium tibiigranuli]MCI1673505.1 DMT family transporter [Bifidobacterium tibiigranuli]MCI1712805.1 DMT family transporter [Bifidobacterium tibiigranuli]MCI1833492.1 DMT family transporter [Bifidobacterium tibiigranuli]